MQAYPKHIKKLLAQATTAAYEHELQRALTGLERSFSDWRSGNISSGELSHRIHQYETGVSRELFKRYNDGQPDVLVAYAVVVGILDREDLPVELLEALAAPLSFYQSLADRDELKKPDA